MGFIFGGDTGMSYEDLQSKRKIAEQLMQANTRTPRNVGEGLHAIGRALAGRAIEKRVARRDEELRGQFEDQFSKVAPNTQGLIDLAESPYAGKAHESVIQALLKGVPNYRRGAEFHPGGKAVVGENGPEVVDLPRGARVVPQQMANSIFEDGNIIFEDGSFFDGGGKILPGQPLGASTQVAPEPWMRRLNSLQFRIPEWREKMRAHPDDPDFKRELEEMERERKTIIDRYNPSGFVLSENDASASDYDPASQQRMIKDGEKPMDFDPRELLEQSRFMDDQAVRVADLDAFKLMQIEPEYAAPAANDANSTESRRLQLLRRAMFADAALEDPRLAKAMTRVDNNLAGGMGALGRMYTGDDYELGRLMAEQFSSAVLRGDSGAQTPEPEVARYMRQYFPMTGETDEQIAAKKAMRREEIRAMIQSLPDDARPVAEQIQREIELLKQQADVPDGSLTGEAPAQPVDADADGWKTINGVKIRVKN